MDCCVCFETKTNLIFKTICNHTICLECFLKLKQIKCPMCREKFPPEILFVFCNFPHSLGIILKVNSRKLQKQLGESSLCINWAYALRID